MTPIDVSALPATPWKNGGGMTRNLAISPPGADFETFAWRVSIAEVVSSGEFSPFPGVDRTIILLDGAGMILELNQQSVPLITPFDPLSFSGDDVVHYRLVNGATRDFNVMTRRGRARADVSVWRKESQIEIHTAAVFCCAFGDCRIDAHRLQAGCALRFDHRAKIHFVPQSPNAVLIAVLLQLETS
jgi:environmental stress-induced protein Ves